MMVLIKKSWNLVAKLLSVEVSTGFVYRTGKNVQLGLNCDYVHSKDFSENIGGYKSFTGLKISGVFSIVF
jgi:hypothetical protein